MPSIVIEFPAEERVDEEEMLHRYQRLVRRIARRYEILYGYDFEEAVGDGQVGLLKAIRGYRPEKGVGFAAYARPAICREIIDGCRRMRPETRRSNRQISVRVIDIDAFTPNADRPGIVVPKELQSQPEAGQVEACEALAIAMRFIPRPWKLAVELRYMRDMTPAEIARVLHVSESRVLCMLRSALERMRAGLAPDNDPGLAA